MTKTTIRTATTSRKMIVLITSLVFLESLAMSLDSNTTPNWVRILFMMPDSVYDHVIGGKETDRCVIVNIKLLGDGIASEGRKVH
jgi:hypothetical protein